MGYLAFLRINRRFLAFGLLMAFFSSFGQTFYISVFGGHIRAEFDLSHGGFGAVYSTATLLSGMTLIWLGRQIDRFSLRRFTAATCVGLSVACVLMAIVPTVGMLYVAVFALRLGGQGLMSHTAMTSMARRFDQDRGKAISIATMGFPAGETVFPLMGVALIAGFGWRGAWGAVAVVLAVGLVPLMMWLLKGYRDGGAGRDAGADTPAGARLGWTRGGMLRDPRFYLILPGMLLPSFVGTGIIFHQVHLVESKGWSLEWFATCFVGLGIATALSVLVAGPLVDRFHARRLLVWVLAPIGLALAILATHDSALSALLFMVVLGIGNGAFRTVAGALWAELYGVAHLGAIRALASALMVFASAGSPAAMGWMIDGGTSMETIAVLCAAYVAVAMALAGIGLRLQVKPAVR